MDNHSPLDITVISASGLKNVNLFMKMGVYVVVSLISGDSVQKQKTHVSNGDRNPRWSHKIKFSVAIQSSTIVFILKSRRLLGDRIIGEASIPVHDLLENNNVPHDNQTDEHVVEYQVRSIRGKSRGTLTFSHEIEVKTSKNKNGDQDSAYVMPQQCPPQPYGAPQGYNASPAQPYGGGWYPTYPQQQMGYNGYNQQQPAAIAAPIKANKKKWWKKG